MHKYTLSPFHDFFFPKHISSFTKAFANVFPLECDTHEGREFYLFCLLLYPYSTLRTVTGRHLENIHGMTEFNSEYL